MQALSEFAIGFAAALLTSIPMLGPVVLMLFAAGVEARMAARDASLIAAGRGRAALGLALGAALAEGGHVALVVLGIAPALLARPEISVGLRAFGGVVLLVLAIVAWRARERELARGTPIRMFALGLLLVALNPGFLATWVAVLAFLMPHVAFARGSGWPFVAGAVAGVMTWFASVWWLGRRFGPRLGPRISRVRAGVALGLAGIGLWLLATALSEA